MTDTKFMIETPPAFIQARDLLDASIEEEASRIADKRRIKNAFYLDPNATSADDLLIKKVLEAYELSILDRWQYAFNTSVDVEYKAPALEFQDLCQKYINLMTVLPIPSEKIAKIKHALKLITFSYLADKWEDAKRFLLEHDELNVNPDSGEEWDRRVFTTIYLAILYLVKKDTWDDVHRATQYIVDLKKEQREYESVYLTSLDERLQKGAAYELLSLYHLARAVELAGEYMLQGTPSDLPKQLDLHFDKAISFSERAGIIELDLILRMLQHTLKKMHSNSIWDMAGANPKVSDFVKSVVASNKPIFELLYPQKLALDSGLLDPVKKAIVVNLPTSSGKTTLAEFRILQALNDFPDGWVAYVAPTRALVNQIAAKLQRDLGPLNISVEKMSGAVDIDSFEENLLTGQRKYDILVTTPEKLNLLIRRDSENALNSSLVLVVVDEAHILGDRTRGPNMEVLLPIIQNDCAKANLLLLTPFIPNAEDIAKWLDPIHPTPISLELHYWEPSKRVVGTFFAEGKRKDIEIFYRPLQTSHETIRLDDVIKLKEKNDCPFTYAKLRETKYLLTAATAATFTEAGSVLIVTDTIARTWSTARALSEIIPDLNTLDERISLVQRFVSAELGDDFPLINFLNKGIAIHNAGIPDEVKYLLEWLMEEGLLKVLVATTTVAQGINFPIGTLLIASYYHNKKQMPTNDFWNLIGRVGRINQASLGVVGIAVKRDKSKESLNVAEYVQESTQDLVSGLARIVTEVNDLSEMFTVDAVRSEPGWSAFLQYISHMYKQSENLEKFISEIELTLARTYAYQKLDQTKKTRLNSAVTEYAKALDSNKKLKLAEISDLTGFSPETIEQTIQTVKALDLSSSDWTSSSLFSSSNDILGKLVTVMVKDIPETKNLEEIVGKHNLTLHDIPRIITDWVSGVDIQDISAKYFGGVSDENVSTCVRTIYSKLTNFATWGLAGLQRLPNSGVNFDDLPDEEKKRINNLPAMIYYGVHTDEAILMRKNNVPRSIAPQLGDLYKDKIQNIYESRSKDVSEWLLGLKEVQWDGLISKHKNISGRDYRDIWVKLSGQD